MLASRQGFQQTQSPSEGAEGKLGVLFHNINMTEELTPRGRSLEPESSTDLDMIEGQTLLSYVSVEC